MDRSNLLKFNILFLSIFTIFIGITNANNKPTDVTTSATPSSTLQRSTSDGYKYETEGLTKRDLKVNDLTSSPSTISAAAKSYDPPPEFYRGPGSTGHFTTTAAPSYYSNYKPSNHFLSKPIAFPDTYNNNRHDNHNKYNAAAGGGGWQDNSDVHLANSYNTWQHLRDKVGGLLNKKGVTFQDRISVGHYGPSEHGSTSNNDGYSTYGSHTPAHHAEYVPVQAHYGGGSTLPSAHTSGYYGSNAATVEGIPFDVYGSKNHHYSGGSGGSEYSSYSYTDVHEPAAHKTHPDISHKALLAKSFLIPLASAAVLGIAAALVSNPLLLQLGTVSGVPHGAAVLGKRKRRAVTSNLIPNQKTTNNLDVSNALEKKTYEKDTKLLPYRAHHHRQRQHYNKH